jgi:hypothetical protein
MCRVEAEMLPISSGYRRSGRDHSAKQRKCPETIAGRDLPSQTVFFGDYTAGTVGQSMTDCLNNKTKRIHGSWFSFEFARSEFVPRVRGLDAATKFSVSF